MPSGGSSEAPAGRRGSVARERAAGVRERNRHHGSRQQVESHWYGDHVGLIITVFSLMDHASFTFVFLVIAWKTATRTREIWQLIFDPTGRLSVCRGSAAEAPAPPAATPRAEPSRPRSQLGSAGGSPGRPASAGSVSRRRDLGCPLVPSPGHDRPGGSDRRRAGNTQGTLKPGGSRGRAGAAVPPRRGEVQPRRMPRGSAREAGRVELARPRGACGRTREAPPPHDPRRGVPQSLPPGPPSGAYPSVMYSRRDSPGLTLAA